MTTAANGLPAAGWYTDPTHAAQLRWWDGSAWSEHTHPMPPQAPAPAAAPAAPAATAGQELGQVPFVPRYGELAPQGAQPAAAQPPAAQSPAAQQYAAQPYRPYGAAPARSTVPDGTPTANWLIWAVVLLPLLSLALLFAWDVEAYMREVMVNPAAEATVFLDPGYMVLTLGSWVLAAALLVAAVLDWRWLGRQGYPRRFHWAWAILSSLVYVIGRSVVVNRQAGRGLAPLWSAIAVTVFSVFVGAVWVVQLMSVVFRMVEMTPGILS